MVFRVLFVFCVYSGMVRCIDIYDHENRLEDSRMLLRSSEVIEDGDNKVAEFDKAQADSKRTPHIHPGGAPQENRGHYTYLI